MALFKWYKKYSVNNTELDEHHKALFAIFNRLYDNCLGHESAKCLEPIIEELVSYSGYHFATEEQYMRNIRYKEIDQHILLHRQFTQRISQLQQVTDKDEPEVTKELITFLGKWLLKHVMIEDKKFSI
jgi:hemerythrin-like metal-binding protein